MRKFKRSKLGQIWVETMIYTLIGFVIIGATLAIVKPKLEQMQDRATMEQSLKILDDINSQIMTVVQGGPGNLRTLDLTLKKGTLKIDGGSDKIIFELDTKLKYSEPGKIISYTSPIFIRTDQKGSQYLVTLTLDYSSSSGYDVYYNGLTLGTKSFTKSSLPYKIAISNKGVNPNNQKTIINFQS